MWRPVRGKRQVTGKRQPVAGGDGERANARKRRWIERRTAHAENHGSARRMIVEPGLARIAIRREVMRPSGCPFHRKRCDPAPRPRVSAIRRARPGNADPARVDLLPFPKITRAQQCPGRWVADQARREPGIGLGPRRIQTEDGMAVDIAFLSRCQIDMDQARPIRTPVRTCP